MADMTATRNRIRARANFAVADAAQRLQTELKVRSPHKSLKLRNNTTVTANGLVATAKAATDYASYVREGTREYKIPRVKRNKKNGDKMLSFIWPGPKGPGGRVWFPQVTHPQTEGNPWWDDGLKKWAGFLEDGLRRAP